jgi:hypothetical protein
MIEPTSCLELLSGVDGSELIPSAVKMGTKHQAPQAEDVFRTGLAPEHARLLEAATDDGFAARFDNTGTDKKTCLAEVSVVGS